jgi:hypothetical protein
MMDDPMAEISVDFDLLVRQIDRVLTEIGSLRDDVTVLTAITNRLDSAMSALLQGGPSHSQPDRTHERPRAPAGAGPHDRAG